MSECSLFFLPADEKLSGGTVPAVLTSDGFATNLNASLAIAHERLGAERLKLDGRQSISISDQFP